MLTDVSWTASTSGGIAIPMGYSVQFRLVAPRLGSEGITFAGWRYSAEPTNVTAAGTRQVGGADRLVTGMRLGSSRVLCGFVGVFPHPRLDALDIRAVTLHGYLIDKRKASRVNEDV